MTHYPILSVWAFLFAVIGIVAVPAFRLRSIARRKGRKGWPFLLAGVGVGVLIIAFNRLAAFFIFKLALPPEVRDFLWIPYLIFSYSMVFFSIHVISNKMTERQPENILKEVLDGDLFKK